MLYNFSVVIPVFNEEKNLEILNKEIHYHLSNHYRFELIFVNDHSSDSSLNILENLKKKFKFIIINNQTNSGQSKSLYVGINKANSNTIVTLDGDLQNNPADIGKMFEIYQNDDELKLVSGIRFNRKDPYIKIISSKIANSIRRFILNDNNPDTGCSLKIFDKSIFLSFPYFNGLHRFIPALFNGSGYKTLNVNVDHRPRLYGFSKYGTFGRLFRGIRDMMKVAKIIKSIKSNCDKLYK